MFNELFHVEDEALEVFAFGVVDIDRMVLRLMQLMQDTHFASHLRCCTEDRQPESLFIHGLRTREGKQDTTRTDLLNRFGIDTLVTAQGILNGITMLGKRRGIQDDQVIIGDW